MKRLFNINNCVWVKLTVKGKQHWEREFNKYPIKDYPFVDHYNKHLDGEWVRFQMHELMELFSENRGFDLLFETNVLFRESDLKPYP